MPDVIASGELLIDFVPETSGVTLAGTTTFKKSPGGAPANVAVGLARLGVSSGFMGKVGDDAFGHYLAETLHDNGVDVSRLLFSAEARTMLAFVTLDTAGEREFMFYRNPSADMLYSPEEVDTAYVESAKIFHFGSISLISEPSSIATLKAVTTAREAGALVSYDPNLRLSLWESAQVARETIMKAWTMAHIIKVSEDELAFLNEVISVDDSEQLVRAMWHPELRLLVVTRGSGGCDYFTPDYARMVEGFPTDAVDTTGAGDAFVAALLKCLLDYPDIYENSDRLHQVCRYANAAGAIATTERGAIPALPGEDQIEKLLET